MAFDYSVIVTNHSSHSNYFMMFQDDPGSFDSNALALAWFAKFSNPGPGVQVKFTWTIDWGFSWADTGKLAAGVRYEASETESSGPSTNLITLDYNGAFMFTSQQAGADPNRLYIRETANIPVRSQGAVGITMSGKTVYATQARPNTNLTFSPHPRYFLAYGNYLEGEVIDISTVNNPLELKYDTGIYSLSTTLNADDTWTPPKSQLALNQALLEARKKNPKLRLADVA
jgi:rhizosphere induced protein